METKMTEFLIDALTIIIMLVFGGYVLFLGRRALWATMGIVGLTVTARLLAVLVAGLDTGRDLIEYKEWQLLGIAVLVGVIGLVLGRVKPNIAVFLIGFAFGADLASWLYNIVAYIVTDVAQLPDSVAVWVGLAVIIIGGLFGVWLVRVSRDEALILITMLFGVQFIQEAIALDKSNSWTAIIILSLGLAGLLVQYASYLRESKILSELTEPEPRASSVAYFKDLQLGE
jgi:hypothetical protein